MLPQPLITPSPAADFNFDSTSTTPYTTAPSSPKTLFPKFFYSPTHSGFQEEADHMDFEFEFSGHLERPSISDADDLFDSGKIKPLEQQPPPPQYSTNETDIQTNIPSKISVITFEENTSIRKSLSSVPKSHRKINLNYLLEACGREGTGTTLLWSLFRASEVGPEDNKGPTSEAQSFHFGLAWYNKWNLKNLLLFRSTSEGSAKTRDEQSKNYVTKGDKDLKNLSFRSVDGGDSVGGSSRRMKRKVSAHEIHYTTNRAVAEEMRRKTMLPYKSGLLGCLGFSHDLREVSRRR